MTRRSHGSDDGAAAVELTLITPALVVVLLFVVALGRVQVARGDVEGAARDAARAASLERSPVAAEAAAKTAALAALADRHVTCTPAAVAVDTSAFRPGGIVAVDVTCGVQLGDLALLPLPGSTTVHGRFSHPLDIYRAQEP